MEPTVGMVVWDMAGNAFVIERIMTKWGFNASGACVDGSGRMGAAIGKHAIAPAAFPDGAIGYDWTKGEFEFEAKALPSEWSVGRNGAKIRR